GRQWLQQAHITSSGLLTDKQAESRGVGGEVLAYVW
ncbi:MAG: 30S ribosomal protein S8, partial [Actinomyces dentalis]